MITPLEIENKKFSKQMMNGNVKIGQIAPEFCATTTMGNISLNDYKGKWIVLFSHPGDFTPV
jgi:peroxiredoxin (alkyl hydroperoxide reductase subunit C)